MIVEQDNKEIETEVMKASLGMLKSDSLYGYVLLRIPIVIAKMKKDEGGKETFSTNGKIIMVDSTNPQKILGMAKTYGCDKLLKHELLHILLNHVNRRVGLYKNDTSPKALTMLQFITYAEEFLINKEILAEANDKEHQLITPAFIKDKFKLTDAELEYIGRKDVLNVARFLYDKAEKQGSLQSVIELINEMCGGSGFGNPNNHISPNYKNEKAERQIGSGGKAISQQEFEDELDNIIKGAIIKSKGGKYAGQGKSGIWELLDNYAFKPQLNWQNVLYNLVKTHKVQQDAESGRKYVNRRYEQLRTINPSIPIPFNHRKQIYEGLYIAVDTSGSIDDDLYKKQICEVVNLLQDEKLIGKIILFTDGVEKEFPLKPDTDLVKLIMGIKSRTYGGTNLEEVYKKAEKEKCKLLVVFSDLEAVYPKKTSYKFKSIFITEKGNRTDEAKKFGKVVEMEIKR